MKKFYLHTLNDQPAQFVPGVGICFAEFEGKAAPLATSLTQIWREQEESHRIAAALIALDVITIERAREMVE